MADSPESVSLSIIVYFNAKCYILFPSFASKRAKKLKKHKKNALFCSVLAPFLLDFDPPKSFCPKKLPYRVCFRAKIPYIVPPLSVNVNRPIQEILRLHPICLHEMEVGF